MLLHSERNINKVVAEIRDLDLVKNIKLLTQNTVILYGAGAKGEEFCRLFQKCNINVFCFCDSDQNKWQKSLCGVNIISPSQLKDILTKNRMISIVITCLNYQSILESLEQYGIFCKNTFTGNGAMYAIWLNCGQENMGFYSSVQKNIELALIESNSKMNMIQLLQKYANSTEETIWICQPGKVASSTLEISLSNAGKQIIHTHTLSFPEKSLGGGVKREWVQTVDYIKKRPLKIISAVREPLSRDYSAFWQSLGTSGRIRTLSICQADLQKMYDELMNFVSINIDDCNINPHLPLLWREEFNWFDREIKDILGIDVYKYPFDKEKGYTIIQQDNIEILLLKSEKLNDNLEIIRDFTYLNELVLYNSNIASQKNYYSLYKQFRKEVKLKKDYVLHYYDNNVKFNHFYTESEKEYFLESWKKNIVD